GPGRLHPPDHAAAGGDGRCHQLSRRPILRHQHRGLGAVHVLPRRPRRLRRGEDAEPAVAAARAAARRRAGAVARQPVRLQARVRRAGVRVDGRRHRSDAVQRQALLRRDPAVRPAGTDRARRSRPRRRPAPARQPRAGVLPALSARVRPLHADLRHRATGQLQPPGDRQQLRQRGALHRPFPRPRDRHAAGRPRLRHGPGLRLRPRRVAGREPPVPARRTARDRAQPADPGTDGDVVLARLRARAGARPCLRTTGGGRTRQPRQPVPHRARHVPDRDRPVRFATRPPAPLRTGAAMPRDAFAKVTEVTLGFWVIKVLVTTLGETGGDAVTMSMQLGYAAGTAIFLALFVAAVAVQVRAERFHPFPYWAAIIMSTTVGTTLADLVDRSLGIGYAGGSTLLVLLLLASLALWKRSTGLIDVRSVASTRSEVLYC